MELALHKEKLERLYERYNGREWVHPDPLEFLYSYADVNDREVVGLVASGLAYGRVAQILVSVERVLGRLGPSPARTVDRASLSELADGLDGFKHRFTTGGEVAALLFGAGLVRLRYGSLCECFRAGLDGSGTVGPALAHFVERLSAAAGGPLGHLLPSPAGGGACKRLNLFLRWMVRRDAVDPGGWVGVSASRLIVPLDVHMHRMGLLLGLTRRRQADFLAAEEVTAAFRAVAPEDPVRYDFALTRLGIRRDADAVGFLDELREEEVASCE